MSKFILDTDTCIYWLKGNQNIEKRIIKSGLENVFITVITECELFYGAFKSLKKEKNIEAIRQLKEKVQTIHTTDDLSYHYGSLKSGLEAKGKTLDDADLLIAGITISNNAVLVTNNTNHFKRVPRLKTENWK